jgi:hypothetical protein
MDRLVATRVVDLLGNARLLERLRGAVVDLGSGRDEIQDDPFRLRGICGTDDADSVGLESGGSPSNAGIVRHDGELTAERFLELWLVLDIHGFLSAGEAIYLRPQIHYLQGGCVCK